MKAALITGSARRLGRAISLALAEDGFDLYLHHNHSGAEAETLAEAIRSSGRKAVTVQGDLANGASAENLISRNCRVLGPVSCLINNAAIYEKDMANDFTSGGFDRHAAINLRAPILLTQDFARQLPPDAKGVVINILDYRTTQAQGHFFTYMLSKSGLAAATEMCALALSPRIRVCGIAPGLMLPSLHETADTFAAIRAGTLLERGVEPADVVAAMRYLLDAPAVTGNIINVDAGQRFAGRRRPA